MKKSVLLVAFSVALSCAGLRSEAQNIYTFAGMAGTNGYSGDDSLSTMARLSGPSGIVTTTAGAYFSDTRNNVVRKVASATGIITTFAGTGTGGYSGDGGPASAAKLRGPVGIATDAIGNMYIADSRNNVVRKVDTNGIITTFAGNNTGGYTGDGGPATSAELRTPEGVAVDNAGNVYIADARNLVIRKVNTAGIISTYAGNNTPGYTGDGGPATAAQLFGPLGIAITNAGNLYIADSRNNVIRVVNSAGVINTFAGNGTLGYTGDGGLATAAELYSPNDVKTDAAGNVYISDSNNVVRIVNTGDTIKTFAGIGTPGYSGDGGAATAAKMTGPDGIAIDAAHNIYISCQGNNVIRRVGTPIAGINITSNTGIDTLCIGHITLFTATAIADATPHYQWQQNGINVGTDANTWVPGTLATADNISCILLSAPAGTEMATSNHLHVDSLVRTGTINGPDLFCLGSNARERDLGGPPAGAGNWVVSNPLIATINPTGLVTSLSLGNDTVYFICTNMCGSDSASKTIHVVPNTIAAISGPSVVCEGATVTYTDATPSGIWRTIPGPAGFIDSLTGVFTAGNITGPDLIIYGTSPACYLIDTIMIDSTIANAPISGPTAVDSSWTITLTDPNAGGIWTSSNSAIATVGSSSGIVTGIASGTVTITYSVTAPGGCVSDTTYTILVASGTGVKNVQLNATFGIYPNPASGSLNITSSNQSNATGELCITDIAGKVVFTSQLKLTSNATTAHLDISGLQPGVYMLTVKSEQAFYCTKLIID